MNPPHQGMVSLVDEMKNSSGGFGAHSNGAHIAKPSKPMGFVNLDPPASPVRQSPYQLKS
jgi:hypothetical protein